MSRLFAIRRLLRRIIPRIAASERGNVAILFALFLIPVVCFMGAAIDYGRAARARSAMQNALDTTASMLSRDLSEGTITDSDVIAKAQAYFNSIYTNTEALGVSITATYERQSGDSEATISLVGSGYIKSEFMQIAGFPTLAFNTTTGTSWGNTKLRVALVFDNTGSMADAGKMDALKGGAKGLIDELTANVTPGSDQVLISLVPFTTAVNVGPENYSANWLGAWTSIPSRDGAFWPHSDSKDPGFSRTYSSTGFQAWEDPPIALTNRSMLPPNWSSYPDLSSLTVGSACPFSFFMPPSTASCSYMSNSPIPAGALNNVPPSDAPCPNMANFSGGVWTFTYYPFACQANSANGSNVVTNIPASGLVCPSYDFLNGVYYNGCYQAGTSIWTPNLRNTWNGCVSDRDQPYDTQNDPSTSSATQFPVLQVYQCPTPLKPLSNDWAGIKAQIDAMAPGGNTNQAIGLAWGWMMLTTTSPFEAGSPLNAPADTDTGFAYRRVVILLSDGLNTQNRWSVGSNPAPDIDARQQILCTNMKNAGITIYTIQVSTDGDPQSSILPSCASSPDYFFYLTSATQIQDTFDTIRGKLKSLRIAR